MKSDQYIKEWRARCLRRMDMVINRIPDCDHGIVVDWKEDFVPDGATYEDIINEEISLDDDTYNQACRFFAEMISDYMYHDKTASAFSQKEVNRGMYDCDE